MQFGIFVAPFHTRLGSPTLGFERDIALIQALDRLGYAEAWIGEHHSGGAQTIASPELFLAVLAERTRHLRLGTGVVSLPYHHPLDVAERMVLLDHLTRGRVMLGVGSGALTGDAYMRGIPLSDLRPRMTESLEAITELLSSPDPVTRSTAWFELREARLQVRPFTEPRFEIAVASLFSPSGPQTAARFGCSLLSMGATLTEMFNALPRQWQVYEDGCRAAGTTASRSSWRLVGPMHIARTREQALRDVEYGIEAFLDYSTMSTDHCASPGATSTRQAAELKIEAGSTAIGTPEDAAAFLERLVKQSGGFETFLFLELDWADPEATLRSYELFADEVMPAFQGHLEPLHSSWDWTLEHKEQFKNLRNPPRPA